MYFIPQINNLFFLIASVLGFLIQFAGLIWRISHAENRLHLQISDIQSNTSLELEKIRTTMALNESRMHENFVAKPIFRTLWSELDSRFIRMDVKLDKVLDKVHEISIKN